jgi:hypothetical protein
MPQHKDIQATFTRYRTAFTGALIAYLSGSATKASTQTRLKAAIGMFLLLAFRDGYRQSSSGSDLADEDQVWINVRIAAEIGFAWALLGSVKMPPEGASASDIAALAAGYAAGYLATLWVIYNEGLLRGNRGVMLTFIGTDGMQSCRTCQRLKGKRMKASWWINNNLIPGGGNHAYECKGYYCMHFLITDDGQPYTVQPRNMI